MRLALAFVGLMVLFATAALLTLDHLFSRDMRLTYVRPSHVRYVRTIPPRLRG